MKKKWLLLLPFAVLLLVLLCAGWKYPQCATAFVTLWTLTIIGLLAYIIYRCALKGVCKALKKAPPRSVVFRCIIGIICFSISYEALYYFSASSLGLSVAHTVRMAFSGIETVVGYEPLPRETEIPPEPSVQKPEEIVQSPEETEGISTTTGLDPYAAIFELYERAFQEKWGRSQLREAGVNPLCAFYQDLGEIGYTYLDIDGNGTEELLIGADGGIFDCYTLVGGKPKLVFQSGERVTYRICTDGSIACSSSDSAFSYSDCYYTLDAASGGLHLSEAIIADSEVSEDQCFYSTTSESIEDAAAISFEEAGQIAEKYVHLDISFASMGQTADNQQSDITDSSLPSIPIDTDYPYGYYEKDGGGAIEIGYTTDESALIYFRFYKDRTGNTGFQEADYEASGDMNLIDLTEPVWNLVFDETQIDFFITSTELTVTAYGPLGNLSADQISGIYYCKGQAVGR